jgi:TatD DNase family protein
MYGLHPRWVAASAPEEVAAGLRALSGACEGVGGCVGWAKPVALGEIGLDRSRHVPGESVDGQVGAFREQLALARALELPVVLHVVRAHGLALEWLRRDGLPRGGGVMHSYSGAAEMVPDFAALGLMFSFSGAVTSPAARKLRRAAVVVPEHLLMIETDAPDLTPASRWPARNEPAFLGEVCGEVARLRGQRVEEVAARTAQNARAAFGLP